jgi:hypothetical protein
MLIDNKKKYEDYHLLDRLKREKPQCWRYLKLLMKSMIDSEVESEKKDKLA